jgi:hypothetical protein
MQENQQTVTAVKVPKPRKNPADKATADINQYMKEYRQKNLEKIRAAELLRYHKNKYNNHFTPEEQIMYSEQLPQLLRAKKTVQSKLNKFPELLEIKSILGN